jgi:uncharacterized protein GlcG (DUF336 family)
MIEKKYLLGALLLSQSTAIAGDTVGVRHVGMELARDLANEAVMHCREQGYQVTAVVVDRGANERATLRDDLAARFTIQLAEDKANAVIMAGIPSGELRKNREDIRSELNEVPGLLMLEGGLPIIAGGQRVGAIGVSGAPGGDKDAVCAQAALDKLAERLEFAD